MYIYIYTVYTLYVHIIIDYPHAQHSLIFINWGLTCISESFSKTTLIKDSRKKLCACTEPYSWCQWCFQDVQAIKVHWSSRTIWNVFPTHVKDTTRNVCTQWLDQFSWCWLFHKEKYHQNRHNSSKHNCLSCWKEFDFTSHAAPTLLSFCFGWY